uniref:GST_C domain-containing protein n=1 Tax=Panagrellus redivivus TaxID=6233 RepID=A0A7E4ZW09_PANRE
MVQILSKAPTITLFQLEHSPTADLLRTLVSFADLPFTEVAISTTNPDSAHTGQANSPSVLPALRIDGTTVAELGPVCRRIAVFVGLHGASPHEDTYVDTLGGQILDLWEGINTASKESSRNRKVNDALRQLDELVAGNGKKDKVFLVGKTLSWADLVLVHFVNYIRNNDEFHHLFDDFDQVYPALNRFASHSRPQTNIFDLY